ncbi:hypothetical protein D3C81_1976180 [compost metagenome]
MRATTTGQINQALHQVVGAVRALVFDNRFEGVEPLLRFHYIGIVGGLRQYLVELG